jgi:hypothetical protein
MTAGQGLEFKPIAEFADSRFLAKDYVFMSDSMHALSVETRFIGSYHSREERLRVILISYGLRSFMDAEVITDAMSCAVAEISFRLPKRHPGQCIDLATGRSTRKNCHRKVNHTFENQRIVLLFQIGTISHRHCPGNICGSREILTTGIHEIKSVRSDYGRTFTRSGIMRESCCRAIG